jgi:hypothetical protein
MKRFHRAAAVVVTAAIFVVLFRRIPVPRLLAALGDADYALFFAVMIPNTVFYFCWDTLVLTVAVRWFHGPVRYRDLLPARAASYVVAFFNTNAGRAGSRSRSCFWCSPSTCTSCHGQRSGFFRSGRPSRASCCGFRRVSRRRGWSCSRIRARGATINIRSSCLSVRDSSGTTLQGRLGIKSSCGTTLQGRLRIKSSCGTTLQGRLE